MATARQTRSRRINLRASAPQETLTRATFAVSPQQWKAFTEALDLAPLLRTKPRLKRLFSEPSVAESR